MPDLTPTQKKLLRFLRHRGPCRISTICPYFRLEYTTGRRRAEELVSLGLAEKRKLEGWTGCIQLVAYQATNP